MLLLLSALAASRTVNLDVNTANPLVSVVVPGVRDPALLQRLVESVARQSYSNIELLIVDDSEGKPAGLTAVFPSFSCVGLECGPIGCF